MNLSATGKVQKYADGGGLYIQVSPTGGKLWRMFFRYEGKAKQVAFGQYPAVSLKMARERRDEAKELLAQSCRTQARLDTPYLFWRQVGMAT